MTPSEMVAAALPELDCGALRVLGEGWNNTLFISEHGWVVRIGKSPEDTPWVFESADHLAAIRPFISVPIPEISYRALHEERAIVAYRALPGRPGVVGEPVSPAALHAIGRFMRELHAIDPAVLRGAIQAQTWPQRLAALSASLEAQPPPELSNAVLQLLFRDARLLLSMYERHPVRSVCLHGDMHAENVLFDTHGALCGIIDFDRMFIGDPAWDFLLLRDWLGSKAFEVVLASYGDQSALFTSRVSLLMRLAPLVDLERAQGVARELPIARLHFFYA